MDYHILLRFYNEELWLVSGGCGRSEFWGQNLTKNIWKEGEGVIRGLEGLKVGLEVLWKSLRGVMGVLRGVRGLKGAFFDCRICHNEKKSHFWTKIVKNRGLGPSKMKSSWSCASKTLVLTLFVQFGRVLGCILRRRCPSKNGQHLICFFSPNTTH